MTKKIELEELSEKKLRFVFQQLIVNPGIRQQAEKIASELPPDFGAEEIEEIDIEGIAESVFFSLNDLDVEELWDNSGRTRYGYVDVYDLAFEMFESEIYPHVQEMERCLELNMHEHAKIHCMGILKGLRDFEHESGNEFIDWAADASSSYSEIVWEKYKAKASQEDYAEVEAFIEKLNKGHRK